MSNLPATTTSVDMTVSEVNRVKKFIEDGLPGISQVTDANMAQMLNLYLDGSSYSQISSILRVKKVFVLYLAYKANWEGLREEYINELQEGIKNRVINAKIKSQEHLLLLAQSYQRKLSTQLLMFLATDNIADINAVSAKEVLMSMKIIEAINNLGEDGKDKSGKSPAVGLNLGTNGILVEKIGDNQLSITPKDKEEENVGSMLKRLADDRRAREKNVHEINKESNNEDE